ncbi:Probable cobalt-precorrin-6Y C(15)-methyltransferase [decarboxylating] [Slackia heliotrinireducens]|uniref:Precorrin-6y C5,15-methyltransferase (Decarboxylating), CbiE subunit,precorrin-6Y C5,15-methyltransferase (Decarboxylating), CbiT subunit n=1 Tax=Slackia heliotrinireducens (strain ATCC 29202 / DSM 20476 / NCTC 11029 / RHS 1) TaxID=471855 RepID=C7N895_SLAHD|nr:precorrin-6Y C5,15-methyltransferase (decarboxylating) subunit CbiT [Slackia heliotrinireducens]ACV23130.1 precorrin-6y C5,15-methyltransferase (decarboxylating), CbiE subunit,precorrin-6Y C5,15-methyltransferase (decarboxylating), CbiT subunit [Slackia heliotrinireducens DSM 20476]VEH02154.1 Probable cobalt-precorrin-6Y C(15)-methyltransferase [decarboxylating] [Slackia heliotrinireducens]
MLVNIIGAGMGTLNTMTVAAHMALKGSGLVIGAQRLLDKLGPFAPEGAAQLPLYRPDDIVDALKAHADVPQASILLSGDVGFYSGAAGIHRALAPYETERRAGFFMVEDGHIQADYFDIDADGMPRAASAPAEGGFACSVKIHSGVSSLVYFCDKLRLPWQDVFATSAHGRDCDVAGEVRRHTKTFFLTGGKAKAQDVCARLQDAGFGGLRAVVGEGLSYPGERFVCGTVDELAGLTFDDLAVLLVFNPLAAAPTTACLPDDAFERSSEGGRMVPMTKEEIRAVAVSKLGIAPDSVVWDVGSGTGSITVACARAACAGQVHAVEMRPEAVELTRRNVSKFGLGNVTVTQGRAPEALAGLPAPDCVFIGGTTGSMADVIQAAVSANPQVRIVATAVTLETTAQLAQTVAACGLQHAEIIQLSVARSHQVGEYHLMKAENPVFMLSADGPGAR